MAKEKSLSIFFFLAMASLSLLPFSHSSATIGVTISSSFSSSRVWPLLPYLNLEAVHLTKPSPESVNAFLYSNTKLTLTLPPDLIPAVASNRSAAADWAGEVILPFFPRANVVLVSAGDASDPLVLSAARNLRSAMSEIGLSSVSVSVTFCAVSLLRKFFPPSLGHLRNPEAASPVLEFLEENGSPLMVSIQPYLGHLHYPKTPLSLILFQETRSVFSDYHASGVRWYPNLFDAMVAAVANALAAAGHPNIPIVVIETGWPTGSANETEIDANTANAGLYVRGLIRYLRCGGGPKVLSSVFVYELFDGDCLGDNRTWGILDHNFTSKFDSTLISPVENKWRPGRSPELGDYESASSFKVRLNVDFCDVELWLFTFLLVLSTLCFIVCITTRKKKRKVSIIVAL